MVYYSAFKEDLGGYTPTIQGKRVVLANRTLYKGKEETFWHITQRRTGGDGAHTRFTADGERIVWICPILTSVGSRGIKVWLQNRQNKKGEAQDRVAVALSDFSYLIILRETAKCFHIITAYPLEQEHSRNKMKKQYEESKTKHF